MSIAEEAAISPAQGGPLQGLRVVEMAGMGPVPFCATWLSDMGADVVSGDAASGASSPPVRPPHACRD